MRFAIRVTSTVLVGLLATGVGGCAPSVQTTGAASSTPSGAWSTVAVSPTTSPTEALPPLGPQGYGALRLGMTKAQAQETGMTAGLTTTTKGTCGGPEDGSLSGVTPSPDDTDVAGRLFFSATTDRLVAIYAAAGVATPQGIRLGTPVDTLVAAFPEWEAQEPGPIDGRGWVDAPGNPEAHYRIVVKDGQVVELSLDSNQQDCYE